MTMPKVPATGTPLTPRERQVLALLAQGLEASDVADRMTVTLDTVKCHSLRARRRLGARNTTHAVALAIATRQLPAGVARPEVDSAVAS